jgi:NAD(P)-dependent dehydrogenase (short-subunit alcohol dehydrogenase family)
MQSLSKEGAHIAEVNVGDPSAIDRFEKSLPGGVAVDILLNIAGIMAPKETDSLETTSLPVLQATFTTNTYGPLLLTQALLPHLLKSTKPIVANMSSRVGSIADNSSGGSYAYRASKAALNSISKSMSVDLKEKGVVVVIMHPGYVKTGLDTSGRTHAMKEAVDPEEAAEKLWKVLNEKNLEDSGKFWHREGFELPW